MPPRRRFAVEAALLLALTPTLASAMASSNEIVWTGQSLAGAVGSALAPWTGPILYGVDPNHIGDPTSWHAVYTEGDGLDVYVFASVDCAPPFLACTGTFSVAKAECISREWSKGGWFFHAEVSFEGCIGIAAGLAGAATWGFLGKMHAVTYASNATQEDADDTATDPDPMACVNTYVFPPKFKVCTAVSHLAQVTCEISGSFGVGPWGGGGSGSCAGAGDAAANHQTAGETVHLLLTTNTDLGCWQSTADAQAEWVSPSADSSAARDNCEAQLAIRTAHAAPPLDGDIVDVPAGAAAREVVEAVVSHVLVGGFDRATASWPVQVPAVAELHGTMRARLLEALPVVVEDALAASTATAVSAGGD